MKSATKTLVLIALSLAVSACGIFGDDEEEKLEPAELIKFRSTVQIKRL